MRNIKKQYTTVPGWSNFYKEEVCKGKGIIAFLKTSSAVRVIDVNTELEKYHARLDKEYIVFDNKAYYNWFVMRWS